MDAVYNPEEGHGFMKREDQIDEITRMVAWFDKYLKARNRLMSMGHRMVGRIVGDC